MQLFNHLQKYDYEQVVFCQDKATGLKAIIAIHDTTLGPALGGLRVWDYETEEDAIDDVLRLARGMTYKNAAAGLNLGGGKAVIIGDPKKDKNSELIRAFGRYVESLNGRYITAEDVGSTVDDMDIIAEETKYVAGTSPDSGNAGGDPSPITAYGIYKGMQATAQEAFGSDSLKGKIIAVQGVGNVAYKLCEYLHKDAVKLIVTDINEDAVQRAVDDFGAKPVGIDEIYQVECDIFAPCALGATLNKDTILKIKAKAIAGSANNQLKTPEDGKLLHKKGIIYAPDYVINSGGVINVAEELVDYDKDRVMKKVATIYNSLSEVFEISRRDNIPTSLAADRLAEERIQSFIK